MIEELLLQNEGKTLEFKQSAKSPLNIIKTVIAFANTAGGTVVIGVEDKTKAILGVDRILEEEERLSSIIADTIEPLLIPDIDVITHEDKELLIINVPYLPGPYYHKKGGIEKGTFIRLGSTNRLADPESIASLQRAANQTSFDAMPCIGATPDALDHKHIKETLKSSLKNINIKHYESLGFVAQRRKKKYATYGGLLLYGIDRFRWLPSSEVQCVCFSGVERKDIIDQKFIKVNIIDTVEEVIAFVQRHTSVAAKIGAIKRIDIPQFPEEAVRESVINAIMHADYSMQGTSIQVSVYSDRVEIRNPGSLTFGQTMTAALSGISKLRNPVIARVFRELNLIEKLGTGLTRIMNTYEDTSAKLPMFEEIDHYFKVTLFEVPRATPPKMAWEKTLLAILSSGQRLSTSEIAALWQVTKRTTRRRLNMMADKGLIVHHSTSKNDPNAVYSNK